MTQGRPSPCVVSTYVVTWTRRSSPTCARHRRRDGPRPPASSDASSSDMVALGARPCPLAAQPAPAPAGAQSSTALVAADALRRGLPHGADKEESRLTYGRCWREKKRHLSCSPHHAPRTTWQRSSTSSAVPSARCPTSKWQRSPPPRRKKSCRKVPASRYFMDRYFSKRSVCFAASYP